MLRSRLLRTGIVLLCLWHMSAIAIFATPSNKVEMLDSAKSVLLPAARPYLLALSQWQQWNLFAPDPLRRVTTYRIDRFRDGRWELIERIAPGTFPWYRHATWFKYFTGLIDDEAEHLNGVRQEFLAYTCKRLDLAEGTTIQLVLERRVLPKNDTVSPAAWWASANIPSDDLPAGTRICGQ